MIATSVALQVTSAIADLAFYYSTNSSVYNSEPNFDKQLIAYSGLTIYDFYVSFFTDNVCSHLLGNCWCY